MLPSDVTYDIMLKTPFMKKVYSLFYYYHSLNIMIPSDIYTVANDTFYDLIQKGLESGTPYLPKFDLYALKEIYDIISQWNSISLNGTLIYRGTSQDYLDKLETDYLTSGGIVRTLFAKNNEISYWSYFPASALLFSAMNYHPILLVAEYDRNICSPDDYFLIDGELTGIINDRIYNYGSILYLREMEIRCYKFPVSKIKYVIKGKDLIDMYKMLIPIYKEYMTDEEISHIQDGLT